MSSATPLLAFVLRLPWLMGKALVLVLLLAAAVGYLQWDLIEAAARRLAQYAFTKKLGTRWTCESLLLRRDSIEFRGVLVANGPGEWMSPYSLRIRRFRLQFRLVGFFSLIPHLTTGHLRLGPLEWSLGFRVKEVEAADFEGVELFLEDARAEQDGVAVAALKQGVLHKAPRSGFGSVQSRLIVLEAHRIRWCEEGDGAKQIGALKLGASSSVITDDVSPKQEGGYPLVVVAGGKQLTLIAETPAERDSWVGAIEGAIGQLRRESAAGDSGAPASWGSNSEWIENIFAEMDADKTRKRLMAQRRRREWKRRWQSKAGEVDEAREAAEGSDDDKCEEAEDDVAAEVEAYHGVDELRDWSASLQAHSARLHTLAEQGTARLEARLHSLAHQGTKWVEKKLSHDSEQRLEEAIEWQVGRLSLSGLAVTVNLIDQRQRLELGEDGWVLRGFVGSESELKARILYVAPAGQGLSARLELGLAAKLLRDTATAEALERGALLRAKGADAVAAVGEAAAAAVTPLAAAAADLKSSMEKQQAKAGERLMENFTKYTGKTQYQFGDLSRETWARLTGGSERAQHGPHDGPLSPGDETRTAAKSDE